MEVTVIQFRIISVDRLVASFVALYGQGIFIATVYTSAVSAEIQCEFHQNKNERASSLKARDEAFELRNISN